MKIMFQKHFNLYMSIAIIYIYTLLIRYKLLISTRCCVFPCMDTAGHT